MFLTIDEANKVFLELYSFDENEIEPINMPFLLVDSSHYEHLVVECDWSRQIVAVFLYNKVA